MIDSLVAQTSIVLRDVSIRVECELRLPGLDRASGLTLTVKHLSISNQYKTEEKHPPSSSSHTTSGGRWSWLWWWHGSNNGSSTGKGSVISSSPTSTSTPLGSLSTMLHKIIHLEEANLFWDLWSTSGQVQGCSSLSSSPHRSEPPCSPLPNKKTCGPTADTMVSSAKLLTLSGSEHTARLSLRVGSVLSTTPNCSPSTVQSDNSMKPNNSNTSTTANNLSDFQLRLHVDLGPIVACAYPSQFYWLQMMFGQLVHIYEDYVEHRKSISEQRKLENDMTCYYSDLLTHNHLSNMMRENNNCLNIVTPNLDNHICNYSNHDHFQKLYSTSPELTETHLIDLDLSDNTRDSQNFTSTMLNSELFRSCLTDVSTSTMHEDNATLNHVDHHYVQKTAGMRNLSQVTTKYSISANILCLAFVAFYEDESVLTNNQTVEGIAFSSNLNSMHKYRFNGSELNHHKSFNSDVELNEEVSKHAETYHTSEYHHQSNDCISKMNVNSIHNTPPAALPGPSIFFARFHGLIPTPNCQSTKNNLETGDRIHFKCQPMSINREEVDTGRMSSSEWVAHLKHQLSNMAYPRDHLCFVGGLWHLEFSNNHLTTIPNVNRLTSQNYFTQLCFNIQLFGIHLSECLFLDDDITTIKNKAEMIMNGQDKKMESFELLHFPYNSSSSSSSSSSFSGSDRLSRSSSNEPAIKLNGTLYIPQNEVDSRPRITSSSQISQNFVNELQIDITHFCVDWDISIMDRIHRITDALAAASEAVGRLSPLRPSDFNHHAKWYDTDIPVTTRSDHQRTEFTSVDKSSRSPAYNVSHTPDYPFEHVNFSKSYSSSVNLIIKCCSFEFNLRFPVPLEAIKGAYNQKVTEMRTKLWGCGNLYNFNQLNLIKNISWWKKTLRKEYLSLFMKKICLTINNYKDSNEKFQYETNDHLQNIPKSKLSSNIGTNKKHTGGNEQEVELLIGSISIHLASDDTKIQSTPIIYFTSKPNPGPESIKVYIRITPSGRTDLIECINENPMSKDFDDVPIISQQSSYFEVGVDLTAYKEHNNSSSEQFSYSRRRSTSDESSVEWSLWNQANPKQNCCTPLVIRRNFVQDAPKPHSKQISYYPGNKMHMSSYRQSASMHTHLFVHIKVPVAEITIEQKQTVELLCLRLMYDLLLWQSLLPNDRRLRATLKRPNNSSRTVDPVANSEVDHRYWFLSDPAPLASIYAHPEAARAAAELEAISPIGYHNVCHPSGLHYHSVRSDDDDDDSDDIKDEMNEVYANIENPVVNRCSTHFNTENVKHPKWKNVWSNDLRKNFYSKTSINPNISSRQHTSSLNQHRYDNNDNNNSNIDNNDNVDGYHNVPLTNTSVQYQSSICFQLDVTSTQLTTFLPESSVGCQLKEKVIVKATNTILFAEIAHNSNPFLNYIEMEIGEFDISYCCNQNPNSDHHHSPSEGTNSSDSPKNIWPVLIHLSWDSIGYPYGSSLHQFGVSSPNSSNEPMISLALEHRQTHHLSDSGYSTYDDEFILALRIQDICFIYWPLFSVNNRWDIFSNIGSPAPSPLNTNPSNYFNYTYHTTANMSNSSNLNHLIGLPNWFIRFSNLWQTPSLPIITKEYPSYHAPDCLFSQHLHFEHLTVNFQMPYPEYSILSANKPTCINYQLLPVLLHL
ncbi:unnamed protein product [Heterobilharzia americana]|nr:unnamed protein product [Heterobilharzia americana]